MKENEGSSIPWYKNYILLLIIAIPTFSVTGSMITLSLALSSTESPVLEGYYKEGLAPKKAVVREQGIHARIVRGMLIIDRKTPSREPLKLKLEHPTLAEKDVFVVLEAGAPDVYPLDEQTLRRMREQRWYLRLYDQNQTWEIKGEAHGRVNGQDEPIELKAA